MLGVGHAFSQIESLRQVNEPCRSVTTDQNDGRNTPHDVKNRCEASTPEVSQESDERISRARG